ncbi:GH16 domain-containing protein [Mycena venus]|uniref:GH16 domain-containing protein n=1 Tax=Mycena venus TaxID=2733690 RepID=A0A8H6YS24_9AGAR|nr:GH16 domain-containing protein [Mycena venus]
MNSIFQLKKIPARAKDTPATITPHLLSTLRMINSHGAYAPLPTSSSHNLRSPASSASPRGPFFRNSAQPGNSAPGDEGLAQKRYIRPAVHRANSRPSSLQSSISEKFHLAPDPTLWGSDITHPEPDDALHDPCTDRNTHNVFTSRGLQNVGCLILLCLIGYPITQHFTNRTRVSFLHVNATGQVPSIGNWGLIDLDTPKEVHQIYSYNDPSQVLQLVFSDEFETEGRSFYPGDDPYWEAVDLHYWQTGNSEWYDPAAITTRAGALEINLTKVDDPSMNHNLSYMGGMISTWNKFCFTGGLIVTNVMLPGINNVFGLWPAVWTMGNLGRAGYGASLDGMWPYSYDACDVGTTPNQTLHGGPPAALHSGADDGKTSFGELSFLPGQRLSRCTCKGESHPGPIHSSDGSYVGRSAPEIDIFEAQVPFLILSWEMHGTHNFPQIGGPDDAHVGQVSQSAQWAPFNAGYVWANTSDNMQVMDWSLSHQNSYSGGIYQQPTSVVTTTSTIYQKCYQLIDGCYAVQGFEYVPGYDDAYITWITDNKRSWTLRGAGVGADEETGISARPITDEPLYILANLGISTGFGFVDFEHIVFPSTMRLDWVRVYQHPDKINIGCDPPERPTSAYINTYIEAYTNPLLTTWVDDYHQSFPKNKLIDEC